MARYSISSNYIKNADLPEVLSNYLRLFGFRDMSDGGLGDFVFSHDEKRNYEICTSNRLVLLFLYVPCILGRINVSRI
ncbi:MAG: hypothetical protein J4428_04110 [Candidatus Aenigmarchaeota archaeon]|nr:hypothetical protein [Candidatus Aenigmarchaeota archaeon]